MKEQFKASNYINKKFGQLTILEFTRIKVIDGANTSYKKPFIRYCLAKCDCGTIKEFAFNNIKSGRTKSCKSGCKPYIGCKNNNSKHPLYGVYSSMLQRCYNEKDPAYENYGGRGIKVCDKWLNNFDTFLQDMGGKPTPNHSIDRIDVNGDYEPLNCKWSTSKEQNNNKRYTKLLTPRNLAKITGYTSERIRQLSHSSKELRSYLLEEYIINSHIRFIYSEGAIEYLKNLKQRNSSYFH